MDRSIFLAINHLHTIFEPFILFFSVALKYLWVKLAFLAIIVGMSAKGGKPRVAIILSLVSVGISNFMTDLWKAGWPMHRPFQPEELGNQVILRLGYANSMGTASGHSANMAAVAFIMTMMLGRWGIPWIGIALITGFSRVFGGVHYPWQVLLGWITGCLVSECVLLIYNRLAPNPMDKSSKSEEQNA